MARSSTQLISGGTPAQRTLVGDILAKYALPGLLAFLRAYGIRIVVLGSGPRTSLFRHASPALAHLASNGTADVDKWPCPPAGLFVVSEGTLYLRIVSGMTVMHELGHALDLALGGGTMYQSSDPNSFVATSFASATKYVTPYAASSQDEYFAESFRAYVGANEGNSLWPIASRTRLADCNPDMVAYFDTIFAEISAKGAIAA